ncbi:hypothetical protein T492DRAFT_907797 [Pavlovales sp. CCMP2436]|nr:hypothetical protein T492DRAFT_907797 [Pavlovales sp. CCMP2436]
MQLPFAAHPAIPYTRKEAQMVLWEVDDDNDNCFRTTFHRTRDDKTGFCVQTTPDVSF